MLANNDKGGKYLGKVQFMISHFVRPSYFEVELKTGVEIAHLRHSGRKSTILFFVVRICSEIGVPGSTHKRKV